MSEQSNGCLVDVATNSSSHISTKSFQTPAAATFSTDRMSQQTPSGTVGLAAQATAAETTSRSSTVISAVQSHTASVSKTTQTGATQAAIKSSFIISTSKTTAGGPLPNAPLSTTEAAQLATSSVLEDSTTANEVATPQSTTESPIKLTIPVCNTKGWYTWESVCTENCVGGKSSGYSVGYGNNSPIWLCRNCPKDA